MKKTKSRFGNSFPTMVIAFATGYFFRLMLKEHTLVETTSANWLGALSAACVIVVAFVLGERQIASLLMHERDDSAIRTDAKRHAFIEMTVTTLSAIERLKDQYQDTHDDHMHIRAVYHRDTFTSLTAALDAIPMYELNSVDATVALAGLKKNMVEIQHLVDQYIDRRHERNASIVFPGGAGPLDLRQCKIYAELHQQAFVNAMAQLDRSLLFQ
jgi:ABC-type nickel/cobalt efflux system permease component RcnA